MSKNNITLTYLGGTAAERISQYQDMLINIFGCTDGGDGVTYWIDEENELKFLLNSATSPSKLSIYLGSSEIKNWGINATATFYLYYNTTENNDVIFFNISTSNTFSTIPYIIATDITGIKHFINGDNGSYLYIYGNGSSSTLSNAYGAFRSSNSNYWILSLFASPVSGNLFSSLYLITLVPTGQTYNTGNLLQIGTDLYKISSCNATSINSAYAFAIKVASIEETTS